MCNTVTLTDLALKQGFTYMAMHKRRLREKWRPAGVLRTKGRPAEIFFVHELPVDIQSLFEIKTPVADGVEGVELTTSSAALFIQRAGAVAASTAPVPSCLNMLDNASVADSVGGRNLLKPSSAVVCQGNGAAVSAAAPLPPLDIDVEASAYASAPEWARVRADKYLSILKACEGLKGAALMEFVEMWNSSHPDSKTSYSRVLEARRALKDYGVQGLLAQYGKSAGRTAVHDEWHAYFKAVYLKEGAPSLRSCWLSTLGHARKSEPSLEQSGFPSQKAFLRRLSAEVPEQAIYLARHGRSAWNRKFHRYLDRDFSNLKPGECIVSDHAQIDVAVRTPDGRVCFPWVTAWRCFKSSKWLSHLLHPEAPNSDHVFQSFHNAVLTHGLPTDIIIDNGRDYRCRDFAGGRTFRKLTLDENKATAMLALLGHFAIPRNAQAKPIERDFLKVKEAFSKHVAGYRGGNVTERPEILKNEIKNDSILSWDEFVTLFDSFVKEVLNAMPSEGKVLQGASPDEFWDAEHKEARFVSRDALKLFCLRTSKPLTIGRNGVKDSEMAVTYWAEFMAGIKGTKVYLRRDPAAYQEAWVFDAKDDSYLGKAFMAEQPAALARTPVEKAQLKRLMADKRREERIVKDYAEIKDAPTAAEAVANMAAGVEALNEARGYKPGKGSKVKVTKLTRTKMDEVIRADKQAATVGTQDISAMLPSPQEDKPKILA